MIPPRGTPRLVIIADVGALGPAVIALAAELVGRLGALASDVRLHERDTTGTSDRLRVDRLRELRAATTEAGVALVVGGRPDLALAVGAEGVQLPERGLPVDVVRRAFPRLTLGRSCHDAAGLVAAARAGADWALLAPLRAPHTKPTTGPTLGHEGLAAALDAATTALGGRLTLPVYALGGVLPEDLPRVIAAGGAGVATIGGVLGRPDPAVALAAFFVAMGAQVDNPTRGSDNRARLTDESRNGRARSEHHVGVDDP